MRRTVLIVALLGSLASGTPTLADNGPPTLRPHNLELLPINELERKELARDHPDIAARVQHLGNRLKKLQGYLRARKSQDDDGAGKLRAQIAQTEADLAPLMKRVVEACREHELSDELLAHMQATAPTGPLRTARYAQGLVLYVLDERSALRPLFQRVVPATEGALLALEAQKKPLQSSLAQSGMADKDIAPIVAALDRQIRAIEKRFWRLVDYVVPESDRAAIHRMLPTAYQKQEDILSHLYALPDLSASQAVRLQGVLVEFEAETAPDTALTRRLQEALRSKDSDAKDRVRFRADMAAAGNRITSLHRDATDEAKRILTSAQWTQLEAIPPRVSLGDRRQTSPQILAGLQRVDRERLASMRAELAGIRAEIRAKKRAAAAKGKDYGPDSPQMTSMQMAMANVDAQANVLQRRFNGRLFTELLSIDQAVLWVIRAP